MWILIKIGKKKIRTPIESWANLMNRQFTEVDYTLSNLKVEKKKHPETQINILWSPYNII